MCSSSLSSLGLDLPPKKESSYNIRLEDYVSSEKREVF